MNKLIKFSSPIFLILILFSCINNKHKEDMTNDSNIATDTISIKKTEPKDLNTFYHQLPESELAYEINIVNIDFINQKNYFEIEKGQFNLPEQIDGITLSLKFRIKNPYTNKMRIPFPNYFYVTAPEFKNFKGFIYGRGCQCYLNNQSSIKDSEGNSYKLLSEYRDGIYFMDFDSLESKEFTIQFSEPFPYLNNLNSITIGGFNKHLKKHISDIFKLSEKERQTWLNERSTEHAIKINLKDKTIVELNEFEK